MVMLRVEGLVGRVGDAPCLVSGVACALPACMDDWQCNVRTAWTQPAGTIMVSPQRWNRTIILPFMLASPAISATSAADQGVRAMAREAGGEPAGMSVICNWCRGHKQSWWQCWSAGADM